MSVKWETMKVVFRAQSSSGPIIKPQFPLVFDLMNDPNEAWDLIETRLDCTWVTAPVAQRLDALQESAVRFPHTRPGEDFAGYS